MATPKFNLPVGPDRCKEPSALLEGVIKSPKLYLIRHWNEASLGFFLDEVISDIIDLFRSLFII